MTHDTQGKYNHTTYAIYALEQRVQALHDTQNAFQSDVFADTYKKVLAGSKTTVLKLTLKKKILKSY